MTRYLNREELAKMASEKLIEYQNTMNRKLVDDAPAPMRPRLEAILFRVEMECSFIENPVLRAMTTNKKLVAAIMEFRDELACGPDDLFSEDNDGDDT